MADTCRIFDAFSSQLRLPSQIPLGTNLILSRSTELVEASLTSSAVGPCAPGQDADRVPDPLRVRKLLELTPDGDRHRVRVLRHLVHRFAETLEVSVRCNARATWNNPAHSMAIRSMAARPVDGGRASHRKYVGLILFRAENASNPRGVRGTDKPNHAWGISSAQRNFNYDQASRAVYRRPNPVKRRVR